MHDFVPFFTSENHFLSDFFFLRPLVVVSWRINQSFPKKDFPSDAATLVVAVLEAGCSELPTPLENVGERVGSGCALVVSLALKLIRPQDISKLIQVLAFRVTVLVSSAKTKTVQVSPRANLLGIDTAVPRMFRRSNSKSR